MLFILFQFTWFQNQASNRFESWLSDKLETKVEIGHLKLRFPNYLELENVFLEDQQGDTLLYSDFLKINLDFPALFNQKLHFPSAEIRGTQINLKRNANDSLYNYSYIIDAFITDTVQTPVGSDTIQNPWTFLISELNTGYFIFTLDDQYGGMVVSAESDSIYATPAILDFKKSYFAFDELFGDGTRLDIDIFTPVKARTSVVPDITSKLIDLKDFHLDVTNQATGLDLKIRSDSLYGDVYEFSIPREIITLNEAMIAGTSVTIKSQKSTPSSPTVSNDFIPLTWVISAQEGVLINDTLVMGNPVAGNSWDPENFRLENLTADLRSLKVDSSRISGDINTLAGVLDNRIKLVEVNGEINADQGKTVISDAFLRTGRSIVDGNATIFNLPGSEVSMDIVVNDSRIVNDELLYLAPTLASMPWFNNRSGITTANGTASGTLARLDIDGEVGVLSGTYANATGVVGNLDKPDNLFFDLRIDEFRSNGADLAILAPEAKLGWPATISAEGTLEGDLANLHADLAIVSSHGNADVDMVVDVVPGHVPVYDGQISLADFDLGALLQRNDIGRATLTATVDGRGFDPATMNTTFDAHIVSIDVRDQVLKDLYAEGVIKDEVFTGSLASNTPGQNIAFEGSIGLGKTPAFNFTASAGFLDLGLISPGLKGVTIQGAISADLSGADFDNLTGTIVARDVVLRKNGQRYNIDSLYLSSTQENGITNIEISSDILTGYFKGEIFPGQLPTLILAHIDSYFDLHTVDQPQAIADQNFNFELTIKDASILGLFIPRLESTGQGYLRGTFNSATDEMDITASLHNLRFERSYLDSITTVISSNSENLNYVIDASRVEYQRLELFRPHWEGTASNNRIASEFTISTREGIERYALQPTLVSQPELRAYDFTIGEGEILLNYETWQTSPDHRIRIGENELTVRNFSLSRGNESVTANTVATAAGDTVMQVDFSSFSIETITSITGNDSSLIAGTMDGFVQLTNFPTDLSFVSDLSLNNLVVKEAQVGNAKLIASGEPGQIHDINFTISGNTELIVTGTFNPANSGLDLMADLRKVDLAVVDGLSYGTIKESTGIATGQLTIGGTIQNPLVAGEINFPDAMFNIAFFNVPMYIRNETITLEENRIEFGEFAVLDSAGNEAVITGFVTHRNFTDMTFRLFISTDHFLLSNASPGTNEFYYGNVVLSSNIIVRGTSNLPVVRARIFLKEGTDINMILPSQQAAVVNREGIVEYVDMEAPPVEEDERDTVKAGIKGIDLQANLDIDETSKVRVIFNPAADDYLDVTGGGLLTYGIEPNGKINLTGKYVVEEGNYHFSLYDLVTRDFSILSGSNITWYGDPMTGQLDIDGIYEVRARARELLLTHGNPGTTYAYDERLPFQVRLDITGTLILPEINFQVTLPPDERNALGGAVYARLQQLNQSKSELNRQVFSLIVFNQFMAEDPFSAPGTQGTDLVRNSVSQILTQQLNSVSDKLLPGVELSFNIDSYNRPGTGAAGETDLEVQLTKRLMNDRLMVKVGGDIDVSGNEQEAARTSQVSNFAGDVSVEYKLSEDGRYRLRAFRNTDFENYIIQEYVATGLSFIFARDFDEFKNLFRKPEDIQNETEELTETSIAPEDEKDEDENPPKPESPEK